MLNILRSIKNLKINELKKLEKRLKLIGSKKRGFIDIKDIQDALVFCDYHFSGGGLYESTGLEECPCKCYCQACEVIPTASISVRMHEIAQDMGEENVFNEFLDKYGK